MSKRIREDVETPELRIVTQNWGSSLSQEERHHALAILQRYKTTPRNESQLATRGALITKVMDVTIRRSWVPASTSREF